MPSKRQEYWERFHIGSGQYWEHARLILIRTKLDILNIGDELDELLVHFEQSKTANVYGAAIGNKTFEFDNGIIALIFSPETVELMESNLAPLLAWCDAWAIIAADGTHAENIKGGPISTYFTSSWNNHFAIGIFSNVDSINVDRLTSGVVRSLKDEMARPVFHLKDGAVVLFQSARPARMIAQMVADAARQSGAWLIIDHNGDDHAGERSRVLPPNDNRLGWWRTDFRCFIEEYDGPLTSIDNPFLPNSELESSEF